MQNLFEAAMAHLNPTLQGNVGRSVSYRRGDGTPETLVLTPIRKSYIVLDGDGQQTQVELWDWIIPAADLTLEPIAGDLIEVTLRGVTTVYEVISFRDLPAREWHDQSQTTWKVHSQVVEITED